MTNGLTKPIKNHANPVHEKLQALKQMPYRQRNLGERLKTHKHTR